MDQGILRGLPGSIVEVSGPLRSVRRTASGHDLVAPQTYAPPESSRDRAPRYGTTALRDDGGVDYVSLASRQAVATELERVLVEEARLPDIEIDFGAGEVIGLPDLPHRIYDAYLRHAVDEHGKPWGETEIGAAIDSATPKKAAAVYVHAPTAILLGGWRSFKDAGRVRWVHALGAEVSASDALVIVAGAVRLDPLQIRAEGITLDTDANGRLIVAEKGKGKKLSELGFGTTPTSGRSGVEVRGGINGTGMLDGVALGRVGGLNKAAVEALCGYGLWALYRTLGQPLSLRSGCALVPNGNLTVSVNGLELQPDDPLRDVDAVLAAAHDARTRSSIEMRTGTITVYPNDAVRRKIESMRVLAAEEGEET